MEEKQHKESFAPLQLSLASHRVNMQTQSITDVVSNANALKQKCRCSSLDQIFSRCIDTCVQTTFLSFIIRC